MFCGCHERIEEKFNKILEKLEALEKIMSTVPAGLAALQQADTDLKNAVTQNTTNTGTAVQKILDLVNQLTASEDPAVAAAAADIEAQAQAIMANNTQLANGVNPQPAT